MKNQNTLVILYFDISPSNQKSFKVSAIRVFKVKHLKSGSARIYDVSDECKFD